jgi:hypothetical protein
MPSSCRLKQPRKHTNAALSRLHPALPLNGFNLTSALAAFSLERPFPYILLRRHDYQAHREARPHRPPAGKILSRRRSGNPVRGLPGASDRGIFQRTRAAAFPLLAQRALGPARLLRSGRPREAGTVRICSVSTFCVSVEVSMEMRRWRGGSEWEEIRQLGAGGQSDVFLVRSSERIAERRKHLERLKELSGRGLGDVTAPQFIETTLGYGREERQTELGALKVYNPRAAGQAAEQQALERLRVEIAVLEQNRRGLPRLLDANEGERWGSSRSTYQEEH